MNISPTTKTSSRTPPAHVSYVLGASDTTSSSWNSESLKKLITLLKEERSRIFFACIALLVTTTGGLIGPYIIGRTIDVYVTEGLTAGLRNMSLLLAGIYVIEFISNSAQIRIMGTVGQHVLFKLRNMIFKKIEELPLAFFSQNKAGDVISRINSDTSLLSQFFSETLTRFFGSIFVIVGAGVFLVILHVQLGLVTLLPALGLVIITRLLAGYVKKVNKENLAQNGQLSAEVQEGLQNFKVIVASNRRDFFQTRFELVNTAAYRASTKARITNGVFMPLFDFAANIGQYAVLVYGIYLIAAGSVTIGLLVTFLAYAEKFYNPLRQLANLWSSIQVSLAAWSRISDILELESNMLILPKDAADSMSEKNTTLIEFKDVSFYYDDAPTQAVSTSTSGSAPETPARSYVLRNISFALETGKTYAFVGPTGGGKTTTASLMARLFDPQEGQILLHGTDIRTFTHEECTRDIGVILQEPLVFTGTLRENLVYGNDALDKKTSAELEVLFKEMGFDTLLKVFDAGLDSELQGTSDTMSLGQKQIIAFIRAVLRKPSLLILDEATANIDTVTEQILDDILKRLPATTTKVIIAHRLNTIEHADRIFFVNNTHITPAGNIQEAINMLLHGKKNS
jgi:ATP-binding cassette, subfamily B, bacterial